VTEDARTFEHSVSVGGADDGFEGVVRVEFRTNIGAETRAEAESPSTVRADAGAADESRRVRRPVVDVTPSDDVITVVAEMPGVTADALTWAVEERALSLEATTDRTRYARVVTLPGPVDAEAATATVEAGVVELVLPRVRDEDA
jgi:HSP20 family molecular chaperone IbpA